MFPYCGKGVLAVLMLLLWCGCTGLQAKRERRLTIPPTANWRVAASSFVEGHEGRSAIDGDLSTWWRSKNADPQCLEVDLGRDAMLSGFSLQWGEPWGVEYELQTSRDGKNWSVVYHTLEGDGGWDQAVLSPALARYVRIYVEQSSTGSGCAIRQVELKGVGSRVRVYVNGVLAPEALAMLNGDKGSSWRYVGDIAEMELDFGRPQEVGSLRLDWGPLGYPSKVREEASMDRINWQLLGEMNPAGETFERLTHDPVTARYLRITFSGSSSGDGVEVVGMALQGSEGASGPHSMYQLAAQTAPAGMYPVQGLQRQNYWVVIGNMDDGGAGLMDEFGVFDPRAGGPTLTPVLEVNGEWRSWAQADHVAHRLAGGFFPMPEIDWQFEDGLQLNIRAVTISSPEKPSERFPVVKYEVHNTGHSAVTGHLALLVRPVQVIPKWMGGGVAPLTKLSSSSLNDWQFAWSQGDLLFAVLGVGTEFGATSFSSGDVIEELLHNRWPTAKRVSDDSGLASGAFWNKFTLEPDERMNMLAVGFPRGTARPVRSGWWAAQGKKFDQAWVDELWLWNDRVGRLSPKMSRPDIADCLRAQLAWMLALREGPVFCSNLGEEAVSEMETGSMEVAAILRAGRIQEAREYVEWVSRQIPSDGMVPVTLSFSPQGEEKKSPDRHVESYAASGQFLFAVMEVYRFQRDTTFLKAQWPKVRNILNRLEVLRDGAFSRREKRKWTSEQLSIYDGLLPATGMIEGAQPLYRYVDQIWALLAWKEGRAMASILGEVDSFSWANLQYASLKDSLSRSMAAVQNIHNTAWIPSSPQQPEPDPVAAALLIWPTEEANLVPPHVLQTTLDTFYATYLSRRNGGGNNWVPTDEMRYLIPFAHIGRGDYARELLYSLLDLRHPKEWHSWGMVAGRDPTTPGYLGDMPNPLTAAHFVVGVRDLIAHETGDVLELLHGAIPEWLQHGDGLQAFGMVTQFGPLDIAASWKKKILTIEIGGTATPPGGYRIYWPRAIRPDSVLLNGQPLENGAVTPRYAVLPHDFKGTVRVTFPFLAPWPRDP